MKIFFKKPAYKTCDFIPFQFIASINNFLTCQTYKNINNANLFVNSSLKWRPWKILSKREKENNFLHSHFCTHEVWTCGQVDCAWNIIYGNIFFYFFVWRTGKTNRWNSLNFSSTHASILAARNYLQHFVTNSWDMHNILQLYAHTCSVD